MFSADNPASRLTELVCGHIPAGHQAQHVRCLDKEVVEHAAKEFAKDERVHESRLVFGFDSVAHRIDLHMFTIDLVGKIDLVGAAPIVVRATRSYGKAQSHRLQRTWLVSRNLEALDLWSESDAVVADRLVRASTSLSQQVANSLPAAKQRI